MPRRKAWNGNPPDTPEAARRYLIEVARDCIERLGAKKAGLADVAAAAGVTRQTVYRYFASTEELFQSAAILGTGGLYERLHERAIRRRTLAARLVECVVCTVTEARRDPNLRLLLESDVHFGVSSALELGFVQEEIARLAGGRDRCPFSNRHLDTIAELLVRLLLSMLDHPGPERDEDGLRAFLLGIVEPIVHERAGTARHPHRSE